MRRKEQWAALNAGLRTRTEKMTWPKTFALAFGLRLLFAFLWNVPPTGDFQFYLEVAQTLAQIPLRDWNTALLGDYLSFQWPGLAPYVLYEALLLRAAGIGPLALTLVNVLASTGSCLLVGQMAQRLYGERAGRKAAVWMACNPFLLVFSSVLTNQHLATFFFLAALSLCLMPRSRGFWVRHLCGGLLAAISHLLRPEMEVFLIAYAGYWLYEAIWAAREGWAVLRGKLTHAGVCAVCFVVGFAGPLALAERGLQSTGILQKPLHSSALEYKLLVGLNPQSMGMWNAQDSELYTQSPEEAREELARRAGRPWVWLPLLAIKFWYQYGVYNTDFACRFEPGGMPSMPHVLASTLLSAVMMWILIRRMALGWWRKLRAEPQRRQEDFLPILALIGFMLALSLLEAQPRYVYGSIPLITLLSAASRGRQTAANPARPEAQRSPAVPSPQRRGRYPRRSSDTEQGG